MDHLPIPDRPRQKQADFLNEEERLSLLFDIKSFMEQHPLTAEAPFLTLMMFLGGPAVDRGYRTAMRLHLQMMIVHAAQAVLDESGAKGPESPDSYALIAKRMAEEVAANFRGAAEGLSLEELRATDEWKATMNDYQQIIGSLNTGEAQENL